MTLAEYPRVLHVIPSLQIGGTELQLVEFIRHSGRPDAHHVVVLDEIGSLAVSIPNEPVVAGPLVAKGLRSVGSAALSMRDVRRAIRGLRPDIVHAHLDKAALIAAAVTTKKVPLVASRRGENPRFERSFPLRLARGLAHRRTAALVCNSAFLADRTRANDLWPPPITVIYNGVDCSTPPAPFAARPYVVVLVANARRAKRVDRFLLAMRDVVGDLPETRAIIVGRTNDEVRRRVMVLGLGAAVEVMGELLDVRSVIARAHVVALTSDHEGFPNVLLEAMAAGRPVVATAVGGVPELVRDGVDGILVPPHPGALATAIVRLLQDERVRLKMGSAGRARAETFTWTRTVTELESLYGRVVRS